MTSSVPSTDEIASQSVGTWKLNSWLAQVIGEDSRDPYGPKPKGRLVITPEGHWIVLITAADRQAPKSTDEKAALLDSMLAYSGQFRIEGDQIITRVDMSSNEVYTGENQDQTRYFAVEGDTLTLRTPEIASAVLLGKKIVGTLTFQRER